MRPWLRSTFGILRATLPIPLLAVGQISVQSSAIKVLADTDASPSFPGPHPGFWGTIQTAAGLNLLYYDPNVPTFGTSRFVFDLDGSPVDLQAGNSVIQPVAASGSGLGATISFARKLNGTPANSLVFGATYTIVNNPHTGTGADTVMIQGWVQNNSAFNHSVGLRMLLDDEIIGPAYDGAPLSTDGGLSTVNQNSLFEAVNGPVPSDWWCYDNVSSPTLVARGVTWGNQFGTPATQPDAVEFCQWQPVANSGYYDVSPNPGQAFPASGATPGNDTAVVLWFTGTGKAGPLEGGYPIAPGQTLVFTTYYGLNQGLLQASPTPYRSFTPTPTLTPSGTISPTFTISPTYSVSPTLSPTFTLTPTFSVSPTYSVSPTRSNTFTLTPTFSVSPTVTPSYSATPSFSASPSPSVTVTFSVSPTFSVTPTYSPSPTVTPTYSISPTFSPSPTVTPTLPALLSITPKPANPDPGGPSGLWLPYVLSRDAEVRIRLFDIAGEKVRDLAPYAGKLGPDEQFWDARNDAQAGVASGVYIGHYVALADGQTADCWVKMAILR